MELDLRGNLLGSHVELQPLKSLARLTDVSDRNSTCGLSKTADFDNFVSCGSQLRIQCPNY